MEFSERLRNLKKEHNIKQDELANVLNYGRTAISNYTSGRNEPSIKDLKRIADYFEVSIDYLVGNTGIKNSAVLFNKYFKDYSDSQQKRDFINEKEKTIMDFFFRP